MLSITKSLKLLLNYSNLPFNSFIFYKSPFGIKSFSLSKILIIFNK
jgi:hypothetical protein